INLRNGDGDILLHFNPRLKERVVVFNTHNNGKWQYEERLSFLFPFERLRVYTIDLSSSGRNSVIIYLNGQFLFEFRQRQFPFKSASAVEVSGDVSIHSIHIA
ncbi:galactoside-binding lectin, partial [Ancylostoma duodenale]